MNEPEDDFGDHHDTLHVFAAKPSTKQEAPVAISNIARRRNEPLSQPKRDVGLQQTIDIYISINGLKAHALIDSGSSTDLMSYDFARLSKATTVELKEQLALQMVVSGSRSKLNYGTWSDIELGSIKSKHYFDISNLDQYDVILGTPFLWEHGVSPIFEERGSSGGWVMHQGTRLEGISRVFPRSHPLSKDGHFFRT